MGAFGGSERVFLDGVYSAPTGVLTMNVAVLCVLCGTILDLQLGGRRNGCGDTEGKSERKLLGIEGAGASQKHSRSVGLLK